MSERNGSYTADEMMSVAASRELRDGAVCFVGIGLPSEAANLARATHAPDCSLIYESGTIGAKPEVLPLSIGDGELAEHADSVVSVPEIFNYWLQAGRVDVGFLGAAQIEKFGNINTTVIGDYGAPEIAASAKEVIVMLRQSTLAFVDELSFVTSVGYADGGDSREKLGYPGGEPSVVITDHGILHPGATVEEAKEATGWDLRVADKLSATEEPDEEELRFLRELKERTAAARRTGSREW